MTSVLFAKVFPNYLNEWQEVCRLQREAHSSIDRALSWSALIKIPNVSYLEFCQLDALVVHFVVYV